MGTIGKFLTRGLNMLFSAGVNALAQCMGYSFLSSKNVSLRTFQNIGYVCLLGT